MRTVSVVLADAVVNAKLDGFTIYNSGSDHSYAGVSIYGGNVVISNNRIINNANGIRILSGSSAIIRNNLITINGNDSNSVLDYGILCLRSTPLISNNVLIDNRDVGIYIGWEE